MLHDLWYFEVPDPRILGQKNFSFTEKKQAEKLESRKMVNDEG